MQCGTAIRVPVLLLFLQAATLWAGPAAALKDSRDTGTLFSALNDLMQFAAQGRSVRWENPETGNSGDVTVIAPGSIQGRTCWDYERTFEDGGLKAVLGTACEVELGLWEIVQEGQPYAKSGRAGAASGTSGDSQQAARPTYDRTLVRETQSLLTELDYDPGPVDGAFGPKTGRAISAFQLDRALPETGEPSEELLEHMRQEVATLRAAQEDGSSQPNFTPWDESSQDNASGEQAPVEEELPWLSQPPASGGNFEVPPPPPPPQPVE